MSELKLNGRLGMETVNVAKGCCVESMQKWSPRMSGDKTHCMYCGNLLKAVRAGEFQDFQWTGMLNEALKSVDNSPISVQSIWFLRSRFSPEAASEWLASRGLPHQITKEDEFCLITGQDEVEEETERFVFADKGVLASIGLSKMETSGMTSGGLINPTQGNSMIPNDRNYQEKETTPVEEDTTTTEDGDVYAKSMIDFNKSLDSMF